MPLASGARDGPSSRPDLVSSTSGNFVRLSPRDFISPAKQSVTGLLQALQVRHIGLAPFVQTIEIGQFGFELGEVQDIVHAVRSLLCGLIGFFKGLVLSGTYSR